MGLAMIFSLLPEKCVGCFSGKNSTLLSRKISCRETHYLMQLCRMVTFHVSPSSRNPRESSQFIECMDEAQGELTPLCHGKKRAVPQRVFFTLKLLLSLSVSSTKELVRPYTFLLCRGTQIASIIQFSDCRALVPGIRFVHTIGVYSKYFFSSFSKSLPELIVSDFEHLRNPKDIVLN